MNNKGYKAGIGFGVAMTIFFILQNIFLNDNNSSTSIIKAIIIGIIEGIISGFLFGWLMRIFNQSKFVKDATEIKLDATEEILFQTSANHLKTLEGVGGKLYLTNKRLVFKSHTINIQNHQLSIDLSNIISMNRYRNLGLINNGLIINTKQNSSEKFVVEQANEWIKKLGDLLKYQINDSY